jgi:hypothetical protein
VAVPREGSNDDQDAEPNAYGRAADEAEIREGAIERAIQAIDESRENQ